MFRTTMLMLAMLIFNFHVIMAFPIRPGDPAGGIFFAKSRNIRSNFGQRKLLAVSDDSVTSEYNQDLGDVIAEDDYVTLGPSWDYNDSIGTDSVPELWTTESRVDDFIDVEARDAPSGVTDVAQVTTEIPTEVESNDDAQSVPAEPISEGPIMEGSEGPTVDPDIIIEDKGTVVPEVYADQIDGLRDISFKPNAPTHRPIADGAIDVEARDIDRGMGLIVPDDITRPTGVYEDQVDGLRDFSNKLNAPTHRPIAPDAIDVEARFVPSGASVAQRAYESSQAPYAGTGNAAGANTVSVARNADESGDANNQSSDENSADVLSNDDAKPIAAKPIAAKKVVIKASNKATVDSAKETSGDESALPQGLFMVVGGVLVVILMTTLVPFGYYKYLAKTSLPDQYKLLMDGLKLVHDTPQPCKSLRKEGSTSMESLQGTVNSWSIFIPKDPKSQS